jgi:hypothetical protein
MGVAGNQGQEGGLSHAGHRLGAQLYSLPFFLRTPGNPSKSAYSHVEEAGPHALTREDSQRHIYKDRQSTSLFSGPCGPAFSSGNAKPCLGPWLPANFQSIRHLLH